MPITDSGDDVGSPNKSAKQQSSHSLAFEREGPGKLLLRDLSLKVARGESLIIMGASGCGKSSTLRMIAGLWPWYAHKSSDSSFISRPEGFKETDSDGGGDESESESAYHRQAVGVGENSYRPHGKQSGFQRTPSRKAGGVGSGLFFIPQAPHSSAGSLLSQVIYPAKARTITAISDDNGNDSDTKQPLLPLPSLPEFDGIDNGAREATSTSNEPLLDGQMQATVIRVLKEVGLAHLEMRFGLEHAPRDSESR